MKKYLVALSLLISLNAYADYVPTAWGQPMPAQCQNPSFNGIQYVYPLACIKPWSENLATFWEGLKNQFTPEKTSK
jgi:hypothetical protein